MKIIAIALACAGLLATAPAAADEALAKGKGCTACHSVKKKLVGPAYAEVAKKYRADKAAKATLVASILKGSSGKWGAIPMPANRVSEEEAGKLAAWVLGL